MNTQADLAEKLEVSQRQLSNYKKLLDLVPELQTAVEEGKISAIKGEAPRKTEGDCSEGHSTTKKRKMSYLFYENYNTE